MAARSEPCTYCPYREDVPSGVWAAEEYEKLKEYDRPTGDQPIHRFACHATPESDCHGWAVACGRQEGEVRSLALDLWGIEPPEASRQTRIMGHTEACEHGLADIDNPSFEAFTAMDRLVTKHERLQSD